MKAPTAIPAAGHLAPLSQFATVARRHGLGAFLFLVNFGASKALAFALPLLLAAVLAPEVYGAIELGLSAGLLASLLLSLGFTAAVPQLSLRRRPVPVGDILALLVAINGVLLLGVAAGAAMASWQPAVQLFCAITLLSAIQGAVTAYSTTFSLRSVAAWASSFAIISTGLAALALASLGMASLGSIIGLLVLVDCAAVALALVIFSSTRGPELRARVGLAWQTARPMLLAAAVSVWIGNSGRFLLGAFFPLDAVAVYSFSFRVAAIALIAHQVLMLAVFPRVYTMRARTFDRLSAIYVLVIAAVLCATLAVFPLIAPHLGLKAISQERLPLLLSAFPVVALQVFYWMTGAVLELRLNRVRRVKQGALWSGIVAVAAVGVVGALWQAGALTFQLALLVLGAQMLGVNLAYLWVLARRGLVLARTMMAMAAGSTVLLATWAILG